MKKYILLLSKKYFRVNIAIYFVIIIVAFLILNKKFNTKTSINLDDNTENSLNGNNISSISKNRFNDVTDKKLLEFWNSRIELLKKNSKLLVVPSGIDESNFIPAELLEVNTSVIALTLSPEKSSTIDLELCHLAAAIAAQSGSSKLCELINENDELPPTTLHVMIYNATFASFEELLKQPSKGSLSPWIKLAESKSPIFRLLALHATVFVSTNGVHQSENPDEQALIEDAEIKYAIYAKLAKDSNSYVVEEALRKAASQVKYAPQARSLIQSKITDPDPSIATLASQLYNEISDNNK